MLRLALAWLAFLIPIGVLASEARVTGADVAEIRAVIHRQIDAFRRDDAHSAFALVSPDVQQAFGTPERFLDVVRMAYRAVYRPASVSFLELVVMGGEVVQQVQVTDRAGGVWLAYYAMQRQKDGSWRTNGCHLVQPTRIISA
jgi:hypothetical protein